MVEITDIGKEAGLMVRTRLTVAAWEVFNKSGQIQGLDLKKRLCRMLATLHVALTQRIGPKEKTI